jgi:hypothetical protein
MSRVVDGSITAQRVGQGLSDSDLSLTDTTGADLMISSSYFASATKGIPIR